MFFQARRYFLFTNKCYVECINYKASEEIFNPIFFQDEDDPPYKPGKPTKVRCEKMFSGPHVQSKSKSMHRPYLKF